MMQIDPGRRQLGVTFHNGQARVLVWAPKAARVALQLRKQRIPMQQRDMGYWYLDTAALHPGDHYRFVMDDGDGLPDPVSLSQPLGVHGDSGGVDTAGFTWTDTDWSNPPLEDYIFYELHTGAFTPEGNFKGIEARLDYLNALGITAVELMPVARFPGMRNWGYDGVFPFAVQHSYGGAKGLQQLVDACHRKGLAVVLDVVYNHLGPEGNYLRSYGPYFTDKYHTPWGDAVNFDDAGCDEVRAYFIENVLMWFRDFHLDALRLDAVHAIRDFSPRHILQEIRAHVDALSAKNGKAYYLIAECDLNDTRYINSISRNGYGMDAQWNDEYHHALRVSSGNERNGYYADFNGLEHLAKAYRDAYVYDGIYSVHRQKTFGVKASGNPGRQFVVYAQNHDQVGNRMLGERSSRLVGFEMAKLLAGAVLTAPYLPLLFMGEEWAETNPFLYFVDHSDPELIQAVREGRKAEFKDFHTVGTPPDPAAETTFRSSMLQWSLPEKDPHRAMHAFYTTLIALRKAEPALRQPDRSNLDITCDPVRQTLVLHRWQEDHHICCLMNFSRQVREAPLPPSGRSWQQVLDSADVRWAGPGGITGSTDMQTMRAQPESIVIYKS